MGDSMVVEGGGNGYVPAHPCLQEPLAITSFETVGHFYRCPPHPHVETRGLSITLQPRRPRPSLLEALKCAGNAMLAKIAACRISASHAAAMRVAAVSSVPSSRV